MFGLLVNSLAMLKSIIAIQYLEEQGQIPQIVKELALVARKVIMFENIYANGPNLSPTRNFRDDTQVDDQFQTPDLDFLTPPGMQQSETF